MTVEFPKSMGTRKARRWLEENNPYPFGTVAFHNFARDFWWDQASKSSKKALVWLGVAGAGVLLSFVAQIIALVIR